LEPFGFTECPTDGVVWGNEGLLYIQRYVRRTSRICNGLSKERQSDPTTTRGQGAQNMGGGTGFTSSPRPPAPPKDPAGAPAQPVAGYTGPAPMDLSAGRRRICAEERVKRFTDGRCLYCWGFNHRAAECAARKKDHTFKAAGAEVKEVGIGTGSEESGKEQGNWRWMALQLMVKVLLEMLWNVLESRVFQLARWRY